MLDSDGVVKVTNFGAPEEWKGKHISDIVGKGVGEKIMSGSAGSKDYKRYRELYQKDIDGKLNDPKEIAEFDSLYERKKELFESQKGSIKDKDLEVGGEGMKGFYDKMVKKYAEKWGKKFGAKVETTKIAGNIQIVENQGGYSVLLNGKEQMFTETKGHAQEIAEKLVETGQGKESSQAWSMKITQKMRDSLMKKGVSMFGVAGTAATIGMQGQDNGD